MCLAAVLNMGCCHSSHPTVQALQAGLAMVREWVTYHKWVVRSDWCCTPEEAERCIDRVTQAARYIVQGKEDCLRKAMKVGTCGGVVTGEGEDV
jgi:hypothetical protein